MSSVSSTSNSYMNFGSMQGVQGHHPKGGQAPQMPTATELADSFFSLLDPQSQGYVEESQLSTAMGSRSDKSAQLFSALDSDSDGKLTKEELTASLEKQFVNATEQFQTRMAAQNATKGQGEHKGQGEQMSPHPRGMGGMMPPPPATSNEADEGFTVEELTSLAKSEETDSKRAALMTSLTANFDTADTDGNGKVTHSEAMAYEKSQKKLANATLQETKSTRSTNSTETSDRSLQSQMMAMMRLYNTTAGNATTSSSLTLSA